MHIKWGEKKKLCKGGGQWRRCIAKKDMGEKSGKKKVRGKIRGKMSGRGGEPKGENQKDCVTRGVGGGQSPVEQNGVKKCRVCKLGN